jgi:hypothetical protein
MITEQNAALYSPQPSPAYELPLQAEPLPDFAAMVDASSLTKSGTTVEQLRGELSALKELERPLHIQAAEALEALQNLRRDFELGEASAKDIEAAKKRHADVQEQLKRLEAQAESVTSDIVAKQAAIREVQRRFDVEVDKKRQAFYEERSKDAKAVHDEMIATAQKLDALQSEYGSIMQQLNRGSLISLRKPLYHWNTTMLVASQTLETQTALHHTAGGMFHWHYAHRLAEAQADGEIGDLFVEREARKPDFTPEVVHE